MLSIRPGGLLHPFYRLLRRLGWLGFFWQPELTEIHLETAHDPLVKYIYRRHTLAQYWRKSDYFEACKPYDLVIRRPVKEDPS